MTLVFFLYGLAFFSLGLLSAMEARRASKIPLGRQLPWLAAFALTHSLVEWIEMFLLFSLPEQQENILQILHTVLLPLSALLLVRFGIGLINEAGPLPGWLTLAPVVLLVPAGLLVGYAVTIAFTEPPFTTATDVWSRYLLYLPGNLLSAFGFLRQWRHLPDQKLSSSRQELLGAALVFGLNAVVAGLIVPDAGYGLASWLNYSNVQMWTGLPVQIWRAAGATAVTFFVIRSLNVFEEERAEELARLDRARAEAQQALLKTQSDARRRAEEWTNALVTTSRSIADMDEVDQVLQGIVDTARRLLNAETAGLGMWDESGARLELRAASGAAGDAGSRQREIVDPQVLERIREARSYRYPDDAGPGMDRWFCPVLQRELQAAAVVPLTFEKKSVGALWVGRLDAAPFLPEDLTGLDRLADQAVIAIQHALMAGRLQSLAVLEERGRIAREMHDGLAQILGFLNMEMQAIEALVQSDQTGLVLEELKQVRQSIAQAQADVRENILSLRTTLSNDSGIISALGEYVEEFGIQTGIQAELISSLDEPPRLSPIAEAQMVRIIQEALANVRKHAQAGHVQVRLHRRQDCLAVTITDDGAGFSLPAGRGHFGLLTMRERAESVQGGLTIASAPGEGTQVSFWLPMLG